MAKHGRPTISDEAATDRIQVRVTPAQHIELRRVAHENGILVSELIKAAIDRRVNTPGISPAEHRAQFKAEIAARRRQTALNVTAAQIRCAKVRRARLTSAFVETVNRFVLYDAHCGICGICGDAVPRDDFEVDHVIPISRGGEHSYRNTQPAHPQCNSLKGGRL